MFPSCDFLPAAAFAELLREYAVLQLAGMHNCRVGTEELSPAKYCPLSFTELCWYSWQRGAIHTFEISLVRGSVPAGCVCPYGMTGMWPGEVFAEMSIHTVCPWDGLAVAPTGHVWAINNSNSWNSYMTSHEWTAKAEGTLMPSQRGRIPGLPWLATGWPWACTPNTWTHLSSLPQHHDKCSQANELAPSAAQGKLGACHAGSPAVEQCGMFVGWKGQGDSALKFGLMVLVTGITY